MATDDIAEVPETPPEQPSEQDEVPGPPSPIKRPRSLWGLPEEELAPTLEDLKDESSQKNVLRELHYWQDRADEDAEHIAGLERERDEWRHRADELEKRNIRLTLRARISLATTLAPSVLSALGGAALSAYSSFVTAQTPPPCTGLMLVGGIVLLTLAIGLGLLYKADARKTGPEEGKKDV
jgi:hypothetical protein